jgi:hypothetical protein
MKRVLFLLLPLLMLAGCASQVPLTTVWRPWCKSHTNLQKLPDDAILRVEVVNAVPDPQIDDTLLKAALAQVAKTQLERRGYTVSDQGNYTLRLVFRTTSYTNPRINVRAEATAANINWGDDPYSWERSNNDTANFAVAASVLLLAAMAANEENYTPMAPQFVDWSFLHQITLEIRDPQGTLVFDSKTTWESAEPTPESALPVYLKYQLSSLPQKADYIPVLPQLRPECAARYYAEECNGYEFNNPLVPHPIAFILGDGTIPWQYNSPTLLPAVKDLLLNATMIVPTQTLTGKTNPFELQIWRKLTIGGVYKVGKDGTPIYLLAKLTGSRQGYTLKSYAVVSETEWQQFQQKCKTWNQLLVDYFDYYQH